MKPIILIYVSLFLCTGRVHAENKADVVVVDQTSASPKADMVLMDTKIDSVKNDTRTSSVTSTKRENMLTLQADSQKHTVADFIIHPLIALRPRPSQPEANYEGKQATTDSTTSSPPWQLMWFNTSQGLGPSVSSLAGTVTGWLFNRIPLPGFIDTAVRESATTSTTTTSTPRPDIIVKVQQRLPTKNPPVSIDNNNRYHRRKIKPNANENEQNLNDENEDDFNGIRNRYDDDDELYDDEYYYDNYDDDFDNEHDDTNDKDIFGDDNDDDQNQHEDDQYEEEEVGKPLKQQTNNRRRRPKPLNNDNRKKYGQRIPTTKNQRKPNQHRTGFQESEEIEQYDDDDDQDFFHNKDQFQQYTRIKAPSEVGNSVHKSKKSTYKKHRQQASLLVIDRNGQTVYVAPELLQFTSDDKDTSSNQQFQLRQPATSSNQFKYPNSKFSQSPSTVPYRRQGKPTQYIVIPWTQLGITPQDHLASVNEDVQSQPLILNIQQSAINRMENEETNKKQVAITAEAVPLLAEASIIDILKSPRIPSARTPPALRSTRKPIVSGAPLVIATKLNSGTIVKKASIDDRTEKKKIPANPTDSDTESSQFIVIGEESGRAVSSRNKYPYYNRILRYFNKNQHARRGGRQLLSNKVSAIETSTAGKQFSPVEEIVKDNKNESIPNEALQSFAQISSEAPTEPTKNITNKEASNSGKETTLEVLKQPETVTQS